MYQPSLFKLEQCFVDFLCSELLPREMLISDFIKPWRSEAIAALERQNKVDFAI